MNLHFIQHFFRGQLPLCSIQHRLEQPNDRLTKHFLSSFLIAKHLEKVFSSYSWYLQFSSAIFPYYNYFLIVHFEIISSMEKICEKGKKTHVSFHPDSPIINILLNLLYYQHTAPSLPSHIHTQTCMSIHLVFNLQKASFTHYVPSLLNIPTRTFSYIISKQIRKPALIQHCHPIQKHHSYFAKFLNSISFSFCVQVPIQKKLSIQLSCLFRLIHSGTVPQSFTGLF